MTEKRSDYRKRQSRQKSKKFFDHVKSAFDDQEQAEEKVDVNPDFQRDHFERRPLEGNGEESNPIIPETSEDKSLRLKKRLNRAILIVLVLIILVLLALFHL